MGCIIRSKYTCRRRAATLVTLVVAMPVLLGFVALSVDVGHMHVVEAEAQNAADAAARAGASALRSGKQALAMSRATELAVLNTNIWPAGSLQSTVEVGLWDRDTKEFTPLLPEQAARATAVRVVIARDDVSHFFAPIFGNHSFDVSREAVAVLGESRCKLWARSKAKFGKGSKTDSYSYLETYKQNNAGNEGHVCSCQKVELKDDPEINGDVWLSPGGTITGNVAAIKGTINYTLPACLDPAMMFAALAISNDNDLIPLTKKGKNAWKPLEGWVDDLVEEWGEFDVPDVPDMPEDAIKKHKLKLDNGDSITLPPGSYYFKDIKMKNGSKLFITGPTTFYIEKKLDVHGGGIINQTQDPAQFTIIHAGKKFHFKGTQDLHAYILAPEAKVKIERGGDLYGAVVAKEVEFKNGSDFHADQSLPLGELSDAPVLVR